MTASKSDETGKGYGHGMAGVSSEKPDARDLERDTVRSLKQYISVSNEISRR